MPESVIGTKSDAAIRPAKIAFVTVGYCSSRGSTIPAPTKIAVAIPISIGTKRDQEIALKCKEDFFKLVFEKPSSKTMPRTASAAESITRV